VSSSKVLTRRQRTCPFLLFFCRVTFHRFTSMSTLVRDYLTLDDFLWTAPEVLDEPIPCSPWSSGELRRSLLPLLSSLILHSLCSRRPEEEGGWISLAQERSRSSSRVQGRHSSLGSFRKRGEFERARSIGRNGSRPRNETYEFLLSLFLDLPTSSRMQQKLGSESSQRRSRSTCESLSSFPKPPLFQRPFLIFSPFSLAGRIPLPASYPTNELINSRLLSSEVPPSIDESFRSAFADHQRKGSKHDVAAGSTYVCGPDQNPAHPYTPDDGSISTVRGPGRGSSK